jgi:uncharacterized membrane protein
VPANSPDPGPDRIRFLDGLRGLALVLMVLNHTARWWIDRPMGWLRYQTIYVTVTLAAPIFLFLVGFCMPLALRGAGRRAIARWARRALVLLAAGYLLNVVVFPEDPWFASGVLHTIALGILISIPAMALARSPAGPAALFLLAVVLYVGFAWSFPTLTAVVEAHPIVAEVFFSDFPPWPWLAVVLCGLALGQVWLDTPAERRGRYVAVLGAAGAGALALFTALELTVGPAPHISFKRDFILNHHWTPRGLTLLWIAGAVLVLFAACYWLMEQRRYRADWLVTLGQTALMLYVLHQVVAYTVVNRLFGVSFTSWTYFWVATAAFVVALVYVGRGWATLRGRLWRRRAPRPPADQPAAATSTIASNSA